MTDFEVLTIHKEYCEEMARQYAAAGDTSLTQFYMNAAYGFKMKQEKLIVSSIKTE